MDFVPNVTHRLNEFYKHTKLSMRAFSAKCGIDNSRLAKAISKEADFGISIVGKIVEAFPELNPSWLITGKGEMIIGNDAGQNVPQSELQKQLIQTQQELINCMKQNAELKESPTGVRRTTPA